MSIKQTFALSLAILLGFCAPQATIAEDAHKHDNGHDYAEGNEHHDNHRPRHGGQFIEDANHHGVEMVVSDTAVVFHVTEHHEPLDLEGAKFKVVVQTETGTKMLAPSISGSTLTSNLAEPLPKGAKIVLTGKDNHGDTIQARFVKE